MILAIDVGNSRIKAAVFENSKLVEHFVFVKENLENSLSIIIEKFSSITDLVLSSVGNVEIDSFLKYQNILKVHFINNFVVLIP